MTYSLGIDLGTTSCSAAVERGGRVEIISLGMERAAMPSVVLVREDGTILTGEAANRRALTEPELVAREFKRRLGDPTPLLVGGAPYSAESLMARLLETILDIVREREGSEPSRVAISHPANWGQYKVGLLEQALQMAGLRGAQLITEPEAAAISYAAANRLESGQIIAVYDLGGGTFDTAVLRKTDDGFDILGMPVGIERLGGIDFDAAVVGHVARELDSDFADLDHDDPLNFAWIARLRAECTAAREALSQDTDVAIPVQLPSILTQVRLTRIELETMIRPMLTETMGALGQALETAGVSASDLHAVLLVGGASRTPLVAQMVSSETSRPVAVDADPKHAIAIGAAHFAALQEVAPLPSPAVAAEPVAAAPVVAPVATVEPPATPTVQAPLAPPQMPTRPEPIVAPAEVHVAQVEAPAPLRVPATTASAPPDGSVASATDSIDVPSKQSPNRRYAFVGVVALVVAGAVFALTQLGDEKGDAEVATATPAETSPATSEVDNDAAAGVETNVALIRATVDAGSVVAVDKTNPIMGTDLVSTLTPPEFVPLTQVEGRIIGYVDLANTSNRQFYDFVTFRSTKGDDPLQVWAELAPVAWQSLVDGIPETFEALGIDSRDPVRGVTFNVAETFCGYALKRLPTEIEWELAARDGLIDVSRVQNWVDAPAKYGPIPDGEQVLRGSFGTQNLSTFFRTIGDTEANRANAGIRCAADDVIEVAGPTGELLYVREFSPADEAHDWPDLHDPERPEFTFGYHAPDVFHIEASIPSEVAVASGTVQPDNANIRAEIELRLPEDPTDGFRYGLIANANANGYLAFTIQDELAADGERSLNWCVSLGSAGLVAPDLKIGIADPPARDCEIEGSLVVDDFRHQLAIEFSASEATFSIEGTVVATTPITVRDNATFGFILQNFEPSLLSHVHYDNLAVSN